MPTCNTLAPEIIDAYTVRLRGQYAYNSTDEVCPFTYGFYYRVRGAATWTLQQVGVFEGCGFNQPNTPYDAVIEVSPGSRYEVRAVVRGSAFIQNGDTLPFTVPTFECDLGIGDVGTVPVSSSGANDGAISATVSSSAAWQTRLLPAFPDYTADKTNYTGLAAGTYTLEANDANGCTSTRTIEVGTTAAPPTEPPAPAGPSQFKPVGGVLDNPIWVSATVVPTANDGQAKKNHFVEFEIFNQVGTSIGKARGRVRNGTATADISTFLRGALKCRPDYNMLGTIAGDVNAFVAYYVVSRESYGGFFQPDKPLEDARTVAVNAATKDLAGHLAPYVVVN